MELTLVLTHACNLGCPYCYMGQKFGRRMPKELGEKALRWSFEKLHAGDEIQVGYFGGEPLLAWDLLQHFHLKARELAREKNVKLVGTVTTNATLLTEERMKWMADHGVVVAVSLDGVREAHDATRPFVNGKSSHEAVLRGLQIALKHAPLTEVICVVDPSNVRHMAASAKFILDQGVRVMSLSMNYSANWDEESMRIYDEQMELVGDEFQSRFMAGKDIYIAGIDAKIIGHLKRGLKECDRCAFGIGEIAVAPSGNLYPCERLVGEDNDPRFQIGHIDSGVDFAKITGINKRRTTLDPVCAACDIREICMNTCGCSNFMSSGDEALPGAALCQAEQINARVANRVAKNLFWAGNKTFLRKFYFETEPLAETAPSLMSMAAAGN
ncbi:MAG TPA: radical SAM protein [Planctomycetota bacterium]|nr:radical SAM protein [Planctomycetota bacterium]